jgi:uncharacterized protein (DUF2336 family)
MTQAAQALLADLDTTLPQATESWRGTALRRIVDLFLGGAGRYSDDQVALFDAVMCRLMHKNIDRALVADLSNRLAPVATAPPGFLGSLARHGDVAVCGPVLAQSTALTDQDIVEAADKDRIDPNLLTKIAARPELSTAVTDVVLKRGNAAIHRMIIDNPNARLSESGFARVIMNLNGDKEFAAVINARQDVPAELRVWLAAALSG